MLGTTAQPENLTNNKVRAERAHYFEVGSYHALSRWATLELTAYYKLAHYLSDAGQFGTTPLLNYFAFERGWTRGIDGALKLQVTDELSAYGNVAWGQCKGYGLHSGHFLLEQKEIDDINSKGGVFCDHSQFVTSSALVSYRFLERTTISGQMLYASGLRTAADEGAKTNSSHSPSYTIYNLSITHTIPLPWHGQKFLLGFDIINLLDQQYFINRGKGASGWAFLTPECHGRSFCVGNGFSRESLRQRIRLRQDASAHVLPHNRHLGQVRNQESRDGPDRSDTLCECARTLLVCGQCVGCGR